MNATAFCVENWGCWTSMHMHKLHQIHSHSIKLQKVIFNISREIKMKNSRLYYKIESHTHP